MKLGIYLLCLEPCLEAVYGVCRDKDKITKNIIKLVSGQYFKFILTNYNETLYVACCLEIGHQTLAAMYCARQYMYNIWRINSCCHC